jgi:hypothetical protein
MVRTITSSAIGLMMSLLVAQPASAVPVTPVDLDTFTLGPPVGGVLSEPFVVALPPPDTMGSLESQVFFDGTHYAYVQTVTPTTDNNLAYNTEFQVSGFTGVAGWSFSDASLAGGSGNSLDFEIQNVDGQLNWITLLGGQMGANWDASEAITFFFVSTHPPSIGDYNLLSTEAGSAHGLAPVPEPGSIALLGSGLVGLYTAIRRRRNRTS